MTRKILTLFAACVWLVAGLWPPQSRADTADSFLVRNALDIVTLCSVPKEDALHTAAANFCHGYVVGAYHYSRAMTAGPDPDRKPLVCLPNPQPTRDEAIRAFVAWGQHIPSTTTSRRWRPCSSSRSRDGLVIPDQEGTRI
ncbi:MAG: Rap1a/Tai family immunity protein [Gammaproteobacteria bacterium]